MGLPADSWAGPVRLDALWDERPDPSAFTDLTGRLRAVNRRFVELFGPERVADGALLTSLCPDDEARLIAEVLLRASLDALDLPLRVIDVRGRVRRFAARVWAAGERDRVVELRSGGGEGFDGDPVAVMIGQAARLNPTATFAFDAAGSILWRNAAARALGRAAAVSNRLIDIAPEVADSIEVWTRGVGRPGLGGAVVHVGPVAYQVRVVSSWGLSFGIAFVDPVSPDEARLRDGLADLARALSRDRERLERSARERFDYLRLIAHELRTPLHAVMGLADALIGAENSPLAVRRMEFLHDIRTAGAALLEGANELLELAALEHGLTRFGTMRVTGVTELVETALRAAVARGGNEALGHSVDGEEGLPVVDTDERALRRLVSLVAFDALRRATAPVHVTAVVRRRGADVEVVIDAGPARASAPGARLARELSAALARALGVTVTADDGETVRRVLLVRGLPTPA